MNSAQRLVMFIAGGLYASLIWVLCEHGKTLSEGATVPIAVALIVASVAVGIWIIFTIFDIFTAEMKEFVFSDTHSTSGYYWHIYRRIVGKNGLYKVIQSWNKKFIGHEVWFSDDRKELSYDTLEELMTTHFSDLIKETGQDFFKDKI